MSLANIRATLTYFNITFVFQKLFDFNYKTKVNLSFPLKIPAIDISVAERFLHHSIV